MYQELASSIQGRVFLAGDSNFSEYSTLFNGNVRTVAKAVACPLHAEDVSRIVKFCNEKGLALSVKAGGYGTAGWAINGDIIIDLSSIDDLHIEKPDEGQSYTSLRDMPYSKGKGKQPDLPHPSSRPGKWRLEQDFALRIYDGASKAVAGFLRGLGSFPSSSGNVPHVAANKTTSLFDLGSVSSQVVRTLTFAPSQPRETPPAANSASEAISSRDPFGYIDASPSGYSGTSGFAQSSSSAYQQTQSQPQVAYPRSPPSSLVDSVQTSGPGVYVTFGAGKRQKEVDIFTAEHPFDVLTTSVPYHVPFSAHPVGSAVMIQGGFGFLSRLYGLCSDILVEVEMVCADGRIIIVNETEHSDLWWAIRGAGPAFGIITRYKAKAYPVQKVFAANLIYTFRKATAPSLLKHFRDCIKGAPRELYANAILTAGPRGEDSVIAIQMCYIGGSEKGREYLNALSAWNGDVCLLCDSSEKSFLTQQDSVAQVLRGKTGRQWYIRSTLISSLTDEAIHNTVTQFSDTPQGCTWLFELAGGAVADFPNTTCIPQSQREAHFTVAALHQWDMGHDDPECQITADNWITRTLSSVSTGGPFPCFLGRKEAPSRVKACFGPDNFVRLTELKKRYDPKHVFRNCFWPVDEEGVEVEAGMREPPSP